MEQPTDIEPTLKEVAESAEEIILKLSQHPAILKSNAIHKKGEFIEPLDGDDLLDMIDLANKLVAEIDDRIKIIYKVVMSNYSRRFPELKITNPVQYLITVQILGNDPERVDEEDVKNRLAEVLDSKMVLLVTMTAATTQGVRMEETTINNIMRVCSIAIELTRLRGRLLQFVESNMTTIAPNLSVIVGAPIAAKLMGLAGGLKQLATMPSCNLPALGSNRVSNIETDVNAPLRVGLIYDCDLVQNIPFDHTKDVRKRAIKWVANKCVLAARCDASQSGRNGDAGQKFRSHIENLISKELEPPPKKAPRPLPAPIEKSGKKRGGKRIRKMKERYGQTELRKAANRINFGDVGDDEYQNDLGFGRTQLNAIQKLRGPQINEKTKIKLSKSMQKKLNKAQSSSTSANNPSGGQTTTSISIVATTASTSHSNGGGKGNSVSGSSGNSVITTNSGTLPSITFTSQQQGLEIYNPKAKESFAAGTSGESSNYFSNTAGFLNIKRD